MKLKQSYLGLVLSGIVPMCFATTPATTQYVDTQVAGIQSQINTINNNPAIAHPVGSCYGGGVVYYVNPDANAVAGEQGLIVSLTDAGMPSTYAWDTDSSTGATTVSTSSGYFTGLLNTTNILNGAVITPSSRAEAATAAKAYTSTATCDTCTDWYLPSLDELATFYFQSTNVTGFGGTCAGYTDPSNLHFYWSSTQYTINTAWYVNFGFGSANIVGLGNPSRVRAVRAF